MNDKPSRKKPCDTAHPAWQETDQIIEHLRDMHGVALRTIEEQMGRTRGHFNQLSFFGKAPTPDDMDDLRTLREEYDSGELASRSWKIDHGALKQLTNHMAKTSGIPIEQLGVRVGVKRLTSIIYTRLKRILPSEVDAIWKGAMELDEEAAAKKKITGNNLNNIPKPINHKTLRAAKAKAYCESVEREHMVQHPKWNFPEEWFAVTEYKDAMERCREGFWTSYTQATIRHHGTIAHVAMVCNIDRRYFSKLMKKYEGGEIMFSFSSGALCDFHGTHEDVYRSFKSLYVARALQRAAGNISQASKSTNMNRKYFKQLLQTGYLPWTDFEPDEAEI